MTRDEITKGIANRFLYSRTYLVLYLVMAALSVTTVVLSMVSGCPTLPFYILEFIINGAMILEVSIRFVAFGKVCCNAKLYRIQLIPLLQLHPSLLVFGQLKQFWKSPFNVLDLILTAFCAVTLLVILFAGCDNTSKEEELLDTLLLVARNVLQFGRLAAVMRQYVTLPSSHSRARLRTSPRIHSLLVLNS